MIPIVILAYQRPKMLRDMIDSIEENTAVKAFELIICDNNSTAPKSKALLAALERKYKVFRNKKNERFSGFNPALEYIREKGHKHFILSDPDIELTHEIPLDWPILLSKLMDTTNYPKIGLALDLSFDDSTSLRKAIKKQESVYWRQPISTVLPDTCYEAMVDTTMAMYRTDTYKTWVGDRMAFEWGLELTHDNWISLSNYNPKYHKNSLRVAGRFTAKHLGWWLDRRYLDDLHFYYHNSEAKKISSMLHKNIILLEDEHKITLLNPAERKHRENLHLHNGQR